MQRQPGEDQGGPPVDGELAALPARPVGVEDVALPIHALQQHRAGRGRTGFVGRRQHHRIGVGDAGGDRIGEPFPELGDGIGVDAIHVDPSRHILTSKQARVDHGVRAYGGSPATVRAGRGAEIGEVHGQQGT